MSAMQWLAAQRLAEARRLLESSDCSIGELVRRSGLGTPANLRAVLRHDAALTPSA
ncbi:MAG: hypothetical protein M0004_11805 [Actinomycetota bacterium]|nr:hypothetical protein [Actinomycetota bacterium]